MNMRILPLLALVAFFMLRTTGAVITPEELKHMREEVKDMFYHGYGNYLKNGLPSDELKPLSCTGTNDTYGGMFITMVESLDSLMVLDEVENFTCGVDFLLQHLSFDIDIQLSLFEINIRALGGLISAHIFAEEEGIYDIIERGQAECKDGVYVGQTNSGPEGIFSNPSNHDDIGHFQRSRGKWRTLLEAAVDLGERLLPAFYTPTGIPYGSLNLRYGVPEGEITHTSVAGGGTYLLEFGMLSDLTGDNRYRDAAWRATKSIWSHRSGLDLVGNTINIENGEWVLQDSGIGGNMDSFFEYLLKAGILFGDEELLYIFKKAYKAIVKHEKVGDWYLDVNMQNGNTLSPFFYALQGFWVSVQVLYGDINEAQRTMNEFYSIWKQYGVIPEIYHVGTREAVDGKGGYPLRPELVESTYYLYRATLDPWWLVVGRDFLTSLQSLCRVRCGFATVDDVSRIDVLRDTMESFMLSETLKYLYLLFDEDNRYHSLPMPMANPIGQDGVHEERNENNRVIFTTEGHVFPTESVRKRRGHITGRCTAPTLLESLSVVGLDFGFENQQ